MKEGKKPYLALFWHAFQLSACTFGGGYVIVPMMRKRFVERLHWIEEEEMLDLIAIAQATPGPMAVNASILVGYRIAGFFGALVTMLGTVLPPLIILSILSLVYSAVRDNRIVSCVLRGMQAGVAAVICDVVITMATTVLKKNWISSLILMVAAFVIGHFLQVNLIFILLACALIGLGRQLLQKREGKE